MAAAAHGHCAPLEVSYPRLRRRRCPIPHQRSAGSCTIARRRRAPAAPAALPSCTRELTEQPSPVSDTAYKHREDLIDALLCAWTASLWARHGFARSQVLGLPDNADGDPAATMVVPARPEQRR